MPQAKVNDAGVLYTATRYTSSSKSTPVGTETETYALQPDTASTALLVLTTVYKDTGGFVTSTSTEKVRITPAGAFARLSISTVYPNGNSIVFNF